MAAFRKVWFLGAAIAVAGCSTAPDRPSAIGEAWVGPVTLNLRKEIDTKSPTVAIVHHGDHLDITAQRRRAYRVRTAKGIEGWTDDRQLMDNGQMQRLRDLAKETANLPSQGVATNFDDLNVHSEPNRLSASFLQVQKGEKFDVIAHRVMARTPLPRRQLIPPKPKLVRPGKQAKKSSVPPPPRPGTPALPTDWVALSKERAMVPEDDLPPAAHDDWSLIRTAKGDSGWVLTSRVYMAIPDEVAQYAEGHRITSYFSIGKVTDQGEQKDIWLWTTATELGEDHDFDGYRVFTWSRNHHRYETAFIQRRELGFFPVLAKRGEFSVCLTQDDGSRIRKFFTLSDNRVRKVDEKPCEKPTDIDDQAHEATPIALHGMDLKPGLIDRVKGWLRRSAK